MTKNYLLFNSFGEPCDVLEIEEDEILPEIEVEDFSFKDIKDDVFED